MTNLACPSINWEKVNGLVPVIIQERLTGQVLMLGYMNEEALSRTCETGQVTFYSRVKQGLWMKGETSGHILYVHQLLRDCDEDTLLLLVDIKGPCCHLNQVSCFGNQVLNFGVLASLEACVLSRYQEGPSHRYTSQLFQQGIKRIAQKVGEEGVEVALAASAGDRDELISEAADLLYHLLVLLVAKEVELNEVFLLLRKRQESK